MYDPGSGTRKYICQHVRGCRLEKKKRRTEQVLCLFRQHAEPRAKTPLKWSSRLIYHLRTGSRKASLRRPNFNARAIQPKIILRVVISDPTNIGFGSHAVFFVNCYGTPRHDVLQRDAFYSSSNALITIVRQVERPASCLVLC